MSIQKKILGSNITLIFTLLIILFRVNLAFLNAQSKIENKVELDKIIHDFGDVSLSDNSLSCTFTMKNIGKEDVMIYSVISSCGCTGVKWTKEKIEPGKKGKIFVKYRNDEGPYPFDKSLTCYVSGIKNPIILRLKGVVHKQQLSIEEAYTDTFGSIGFKSGEINAGIMQQEEQKSGEFFIANLGKDIAKIDFSDVSKDLKIKVRPNPIPPRTLAKVNYTISSQRDKWGRSSYKSKLIVNNKKISKPLTFNVVIKENFSDWGENQKKEASKPIFKSSNSSFGKITKGEKIKAHFTYTNKGKANFVIYKVDSEEDIDEIRYSSCVQNGEEGTIELEFDSNKLNKGECLIIISVISNSPFRPIINLFVTGYIV